MGFQNGKIDEKVRFQQRLTAKQRGMLDELAKELEASNFPDAQRLASAAKIFYSRKEKLAR